MPCAAVTTSGCSSSASHCCMCVNGCQRNCLSRRRSSSVECGGIRKENLATDGARMNTDGKKSEAVGGDAVKQEFIYRFTASLHHRVTLFPTCAHLCPSVANHLIATSS